MCEQKSRTETWVSYCKRNPTCLSCPQLPARLVGSSRTLLSAGEVSDEVSDGAASAVNQPKSDTDWNSDSFLYLDQQAALDEQASAQNILTLAEFLSKHGLYESAVVSYHHTLQTVTDLDHNNANILISALRGQARSLQALDRTLEADSAVAMAKQIESLLGLLKT